MSIKLNWLTDITQVGQTILSGYSNMFRSFSKGKKRNDAEKKEKEREKERGERVGVKKGDGKPAPTFEEMRAFLIGNATEEEMN